MTAGVNKTASTNKTVNTVFNIFLRASILLPHVSYCFSWNRLYRNLLFVKILPIQLLFVSEDSDQAFLGI
jgi:hypothetical protein